MPHPSRALQVHACSSAICDQRSARFAAASGVVMRRIPARSKRLASSATDAAVRCSSEDTVSCTFSFASLCPANTSVAQRAVPQVVGVTVMKTSRANRLLRRSLFGRVCAVVCGEAIRAENRCSGSLNSRPLDTSSHAIS